MQVKAPVSFFNTYLIACGKPAGHREVAPREFDVHSRWKPEREAEAAEEEEGRRRESRKTEATCVASAFRDNLLTGYHFRTDHSK